MKGCLFDRSSMGIFREFILLFAKFFLFQTFCDNCLKRIFPLSFLLSYVSFFSDEIGMKITGLWKLINALVRTSNKPDRLLLNWNEQSVEKRK